MLNMLFQMFKMIFTIIKYPLYLLLIFIAAFMFLCGIWFVIRFAQGKRLKKGTRQSVKKESFFKRIFIKLPRQFVDDCLNKDPDFFNYQGLIVFEGRQGMGKTISMVEFARRMQKEYPRALCASNIAYNQEDQHLTDWKFLVNWKNGIYGIIGMIDELPQWFSSNDSKNFPPDMLEVICQNRKNRRILLGTAQSFYMCAKALRTQATEVRRCATFLGCLTWVRRYEPKLDSEGNVIEFKYLGSYFFVHDKELRESYDTLEVVKRLTKVGFQDRNYNISDNPTNNILISKKSIK